MAGKAKYTVWGYWSDSFSELSPQRKCVGEAESIEQAREIKNDAEIIGWPTVCISEKDLIVEPTEWAGRRHPL
jgi:hypothetical protein